MQQNVECTLASSITLAESMLTACHLRSHDCVESSSDEQPPAGNGAPIPADRQCAEQMYVLYLHR